MLFSNILTVISNRNISEKTRLIMSSWFIDYSNLHKVCVVPVLVSAASYHSYWTPAENMVLYTTHFAERANPWTILSIPFLLTSQDTRTIYASFVSNTKQKNTCRHFMLGTIWTVWHIRIALTQYLGFYNWTVKEI